MLQLYKYISICMKAMSDIIISCIWIMCVASEMHPLFSPADKFSKYPDLCSELDKLC